MLRRYECTVILPEELTTTQAIEIFVSALRAQGYEAFDAVGMPPLYQATVIVRPARQPDKDGGQ